MAENVEAGRVAVVFEAQFGSLQADFSAELEKLKQVAVAKGKEVATAMSDAFGKQAFTIGKVVATPQALAGLVGQIQAGLDAHTFSVRIAPAGGVMPAPGASGAGYAASSYAAGIGGQRAGVPVPSPPTPSIVFASPPQPTRALWPSFSIAAQPPSYAASPGQPNLFGQYPVSSQMPLPGMGGPGSFEYDAYGSHVYGNRGYVPQRSFAPPYFPGMAAPNDWRRSINNQSARFRIASGGLPDTDEDIAGVRQHLMGMRARGFNAPTGVIQQQSHDALNKALQEGFVMPWKGMMERVGSGWREAIYRTERESMRHLGTGMALTFGFTYPVVAAMRGAAMTTADYQRRMALIPAMTDIPRAQIPFLNRAAFGEARRTGQTPADLADAMYFIASTGYGASQTRDILRAAATGAGGGMGSPRILGDVLTTALQQYGEPSSRAMHYMDVIAEAAAQGKGEPGTYAPAVGKVIARGRRAGLSFEQVAANISTYTRAGLPANQAAISLNMLLENLTDPSKKAQKVLAQMGTSSDEVLAGLHGQGPHPGFFNTITDLFKKAEKVGNPEVVMSQLIGSVTGLRNAMTTAGSQTDSYRQILDKLEHSAGRSQHAFDEMATTIDTQWNRVISSIKAETIELTDRIMPNLGKSIKQQADSIPGYVRTIITAWEALPPQVRTGAAYAGGALALSGPALMGIGMLGNLRAAGMVVGGALMSQRNLVGAGAALALRSQEFGGAQGNAVLDAIIAANLGMIAIRGGNRLLSGVTGGIGGIRGAYGSARTLAAAGAGIYEAGGLLGLLNAPIGAGAVGTAALGASGLVAGGATIGGFGLATAYQNYLDKQNVINLNKISAGSGREGVESIFSRLGFYTAPSSRLQGQGRASARSLVEGLSGEFATVDSGSSLDVFRGKVDRVIRDIESKKIKLDIEDEDSAMLIKSLKEIRNQASLTGNSLRDFYDEIDKASKRGVMDDLEKSWREVGGIVGLLNIDLKSTLNLLGQIGTKLSGGMFGSQSIPSNQRPPTITVLGPNGQPIQLPTGGTWSPPSTVASSIQEPPSSLRRAWRSEQQAIEQDSLEYSDIFATQMSTPAGIRKLYADLMKQRKAGTFGASKPRYLQLKGRFLKEVVEPAFNALPSNAPYHGGSGLPDETATMAQKMAKDAEVKRLQEQKSALESYINSLEGVTGKIRAYGQQTEEAAMRNAMLDKSLRSLSDSFKQGAISVSQLYDQMARLGSLKDILKDWFGGFQKQMLGFGIVSGVRGMSGAARVENALQYGTQMGAWQDEAVRQSGNLIGQPGQMGTASGMSYNLQRRLLELSNTADKDYPVGGLRSKAGWWSTFKSDARIVGSRLVNRLIGSGVSVVLPDPHDVYAHSSFTHPLTYGRGASSSAIYNYFKKQLPYMDYPDTFGQYIPQGLGPSLEGYTKFGKGAGPLSSIDMRVSTDVMRGMSAIGLRQKKGLSAVSAAALSDPNNLRSLELFLHELYHVEQLRSAQKAGIKPNSPVWLGMLEGEAQYKAHEWAQEFTGRKWPNTVYQKETAAYGSMRHSNVAMPAIGLTPGAFWKDMSERAVWYRANAGEKGGAYSKARIGYAEEIERGLPGWRSGFGSETVPLSKLHSPGPINPHKFRKVSDFEREYEVFRKKSLHEQGTLLQEAPAWMQRGWGGILNDLYPDTERQRELQDKLFSPEGISLMSKQYGGSLQGQLAGEYQMSILRDEADRQGRRYGGAHSEYDRILAARQVRGQAALNYQPLNPFADLEAGLADGSLTPTRYSWMVNQRKAAMAGTAFRQRWDEKRAYGSERAGFAASGVGLGSGDYNPGMAGIAGQMAQWEADEWSNPQSIFRQTFAAGYGRQAWNGLQTRRGEKRTQLTSSLSREGEIWNDDQLHRQRMANQLLQEEAELRKDQTRSEEDINDILAARQVQLEAEDRLTKANVAGAKEKAAALSTEASYGRLLARQNAESSRLRASSKESVLAVTNYAIQRSALSGGADPDSMLYQQEAELSEMRNRVLNTDSIINKTQEISNQTAIIKGRYSIGALSEYSAQGFARKDARTAMGDQSGVLGGILGMKRRYAGMWTPEQIAGTAADTMDLAHQQRMLGLNLSTQSAYARNDLEASMPGYAADLNAWKNQPEYGQRAGQIQEEIGGRRALMSAQAGAQIVGNYRQQTLQMREQLRLATAITETAKVRAGFEAQIDQLRAQGIPLSEKDLAIGKAASEQAAKDAERFHLGMGVAQAFSTGFQALWSGFGRDTGRRDRTQQRLGESERYLGQIRGFQETGIEPGSPEWEQARARHDIMASDIDRTKGKGGVLGNAARDFLNPFWEMLQKTAMEKVEDWVIKKSGLGDWLGKQSPQVPTGPMGDIAGPLSKIPGVGSILGIGGQIAAANSQAQMVQNMAQTVMQATMTINGANINVNGATISGVGGQGAAGGGGWLGTVMDFLGTGNGGGPRPGSSPEQIANLLGIGPQGL